MGNNKEQVVKWLQDNVNTKIQKSLYNIINANNAGLLTKKDFVEKTSLLRLILREINNLENNILGRELSLETEIGMIKDAHIRDCVNMFLTNHVDENFFTAPSSTTGKYHPVDEILEGGLVLHTKRVCKVVRDLCEINSLDEDAQDILIASAILHDTCHNGKKGAWAVYSCHEHPVLCADTIIQVFHDDEKMAEIADVIKTHSGKWNINRYSNTILPLPETQMQKILHTADYVASREYTIINV